jgi:hypothetical protein
VKYLIAIAVIMFSGCGVQTPPADIVIPITETTEAQEAARFEAVYHGYFVAGREDTAGKRVIYVVRDRYTGVEYLAVQGCGTSQLVPHVERSGKFTRTVYREE